VSFKDFPGHRPSIQLLQRSLERGRLAHGYLFTGEQLDELETLARTLAKTLNCLQPVQKGSTAIDCCDRCANCKKIDLENHPDVFWVRPESKLRLIKIGQITRREDSPDRVLLDAVNLKPSESRYKFAVIAAADRMNDQAANALLKTLEEPPQNSVLVLLSTEPQRILETILSRCLRLSFSGEGVRRYDPSRMEWLTSFSEMAAGHHKSLFSRYRLMDVLLRQLNHSKETIEKGLAARSPLERYPDAEKEVQERWEDELKAAIEAEYRRQRGDWLCLLQSWLRDIWLQTLLLDKQANSNPSEQKKVELLHFPELKATRQIALRISTGQATANLQVIELLQQQLTTNVQEALALEVGLLKLHL
jgi:DNA polymerase III subunit delta'